MKWIKAKRCNYGACVEMSKDGDLISIRDSKDPKGPVLQFDKDEIQTFLDGVKDGDFDDLLR